MTMTNTPNGRATRKSLAEQIDRLDQILDCLADGLNEAVATAVREAVGIAAQQAVQTVFTEILTNPAVLAKLQGLQAVAIAQPTNEVRKPTLRERIRRIQSWIGDRLRDLGQVCSVVSQYLYQRSVSLGNRLQVLRQFKGPLLIALGVGVLMGVTAYFAGPWLRGVASGLGGFTTTLAVKAGVLLRRMLGGLPVCRA